MKVMTVVGTRPEIIRLARVIDALERHTDHVLVHTGQNWDTKLNEVFFEDLQLRMPDYNLGIPTGSLGALLGGILEKTEEVLRAESPDAFLVLGDTNSALSIIMAKRLHIPTYHMEAGNRCFDANVPEEINRRIVDHVADFNCVYTEHARRNLLAEGIEPRRILLTGSPMREVLDHQRARIEASRVLDDLGVTTGEFFLVSAHREETVDNPERLAALLASLDALAARWGLPVIVSTHPRTRRRLEEFDAAQTSSLLRFCEPFGFLDYNKLQLAARCVLSDSGTISEESAILGFRAVTLRSSIERPEALDTGTMIMCDVRSGEVLSAVELALSGDHLPPCPVDYLPTNTSERMVRFITSTAPRHREWSGLR